MVFFQFRLPAKVFCFRISFDTVEHRFTGRKGVKRLQQADKTTNIYFLQMYTVFFCVFQVLCLMLQGVTTTRFIWQEVH